MFYPDPGTECQVDHGPHVRAVGWLSKDHPYPTGAAHPTFVGALREHMAHAWQPVAAGGTHLCELCERASGRAPEPTCGSRGTDAVFVAPALVTHRVEAHVHAASSLRRRVAREPHRSGFAWKHRRRRAAVRPLARAAGPGETAEASAGGMHGDA